MFLDFLKNRLLIWFLSFSSLAAGSTYTFSPIFGINGLSDNGVRSLSQLNDGRMIVVTEGLVHLYDGVNFHYMHFDEQKAYPLNGYSGYHRIYTDSEQYLWIKTTRKLLLFDIRKEHFISDIKTYWDKYGISDPIMDFFVDTNHGIWIHTKKDELWYKKKGHKTFHLFKTNSSIINGNKQVLHDLAIMDGSLYLFFQSGLVQCHSLENAELVYQTSAFPEQKNPYDKTLLVVTHQHYLYQVRNSNRGGLLNRYDTKSHNWINIMETPYNLNTLTFDEKGTCWLSSQVGLWKIEVENNKKNLISPLPLINEKSIETEISVQYTDKQGGLWVGTHNQGLLYHHPNRWLFQYVKLNNTSNNYNHVATSIFDFEESSSNSILIGTSNGLYQYSQERDSVNLFLNIPEEAVCQDLYKDHNNHIWLCTQNFGIYKIDSLEIIHHTLPFNCRSITESSSSRLYLCIDEGFGLFDPIKGTYLDIPAVKKAQLGAITQLIAYGKNYLLGFSKKGLFLFDEQSQTLSFPATGSKPLFEHPNQQYQCLFVDSREWIWFGTQDGLNVFNPSVKKSRTLRREDGLIGNSIRSVAEDDAGNIWVSTTNGISCLNINNQNYIDTIFFCNFDHTDGVMEGTFVPRSIMISNKQELFCGGNNGFNKLSIQWPSERRNNGTKPLFTRFIVSGQEIKTGIEYNERILLPQAIASTEKIILNQNQSSFLLECTGLNFIQPDQTYYTYRLNGLEEDWHCQKPTDGVGRIFYSDLKPGTYVLTIFAENKFSLSVSPLAKLTVVIKPSALKTPLAFILYALFALMFAWGMLVLRSKKESTRIEMNKVLSKNKSTLDINLNKSDLPSPDEVLLKRIVELVENNLSNSSYSVEQLSKDLCMDRSNLYRKLSSLVDKTPSEFLRLIRLKRAACLLERGFRVSEVAEQVGFNSNSYFSKCFQETYGVTPSQYKKKSTRTKCTHS